MGHLSMEVGPSRDRASDDTAQNAASSCSGSDETGPPGRKEKPRSRPRPAHHEIGIRPLTRPLAESRTYAGGKHPRLPCCGPARGSVQRAGSLPHPPAHHEIGIPLPAFVQRSSRVAHLLPAAAARDLPPRLGRCVIPLTLGDLSLT